MTVSGGRQRSFCRYCGRMTTYPDGCCAAHRDLLPLDPNSRESNDLDMTDPTAAQWGEESQASKGKGD